MTNAMDFGRLSPWRDNSGLNDKAVREHAARLELTRRIVAAYSDLGWVNGLFVRELPGLMAGLGIVNVKTRGFMPLESGGYYANRAERSAEAAAQAGLITKDELARWLQAYRAEVAAGRFLGGQLHLFVWGTRPAA